MKSILMSVLFMSCLGASEEKVQDSQGFKGNWTEKFVLNDDTEITHKPTKVLFNGVKFSDENTLGLRMTKRKYNSMMTRFYDTTIPETVLFDLRIDSTREEFVQQLVNAGLYNQS